MASGIVTAFALCSACGGTGEAARPIGGSLDRAEGRPHAAGVASDPPFALPSATPAASAEQGLVVLRQPTDVRPVRQVVMDFFDAVVAESPDSLERLFDRAAHIRTTTKNRAEAAMPVWRRRFERLDYTAVTSESLFRAADVQIHTAADAAALGPARALPITPRADEVVVRVPLLGGAALSRLFGPEIVFLVKNGPDGYKIGELFEDFRLP